jgi:5-methylcytosine-specific restriction endonuclease McrA
MKTKPYNGGQWTEARRNAFIKSALRNARWPVKYAALTNARVGKRINPATGRLAMFHVCADCNCDFVAKDVVADHIVPVVLITGFDSWDGVIERLFCEVDGFQCLCKECHSRKTKGENAMRRASAKAH